MAPTVKTYKRLVIDGVEVRAISERVPSWTAGGPQRGAHVKSCYPIEVDGVRRGWLAYCSGRAHFSSWSAGWHLLNHLPQDWRSYGSGHHLPNPSASRPPGHRAFHAYERDDALAKVPALIAAGGLPTVEEAAVILAETDRQLDLSAEARRVGIALSKRQADDARLSRERAERERETQRLEIVEGLQSIRDRLGAQLSNFETDALLRAISRLGGEASVRPAEGAER